MVTEDYIASMSKLIADGQIAEIGEVGAKALVSITSQIAALRQEEIILRMLLARYAPEFSLLRSRLSDQGVSGVNSDGLQPSIRSNYIRQAVIKLIQAGHSCLSSRQVITVLAQEGVVFSILKPTSMAGTVMATMPELTRVARDTYAVIKRE